MASNSELHLMNQLLNLEGVKVKDYRIIEGIGIILSLENTQKKVLCPNCRKTTELLHQNNFQTVRDLSFGQQLGFYRTYCVKTIKIFDLFLAIAKNKLYQT